MGNAGRVRRRLAATALVGLLPMLLLTDTMGAAAPVSAPTTGRGASILGPTGGSFAVSSQQRAVHRLVNETRSANNRRGLRREEVASAAAQAWAERLLACRCLRHRRAPFGAPARWFAAAENVGRGYTITATHKAFLRSTQHRTNILTARMTHIATGVARAPDGEYFIVQAFYDLV